MSFAASAFRVFIASPGDVQAERAQAVEAIQSWNDQNATDRQVVLLPVRWETHSAPSYGERPQAIINRQVADGADLVVGIFWSRLGSPTGVSESGTIEEIERAADQSRPVMIYFSSAPQVLDQVDLEQLARLRAFRDRIRPKALFETYADTGEFRAKFARQLDIRVKELISKASGAEGIESEARADGSGIMLELVDPYDEDAGLTTATVLTTLLTCSNPEDLPDLTTAPEEESGMKSRAHGNLLESTLHTGSSSLNIEYYRQMFQFEAAKAASFSLEWMLRNVGRIGARDIHVDLTFATDEPVLCLLSESAVMIPRPRRRMGNRSFRQLSDIFEFSSDWSHSFDVPALQPQRVLKSDPEIRLAAKQSCVVKVTATIYADSLPTPERQEIEIRVTVEELQIAAEEYVRKIDSQDGPWRPT